jgi:hypothetical protein
MYSAPFDWIVMAVPGIGATFSFVQYKEPRGLSRATESVTHESPAVE